jgi:hypothetical protein
MKASDAKPFIGKLVSYKKAGWPHARTGIVQSTSGRNIIMDDDALWAPDISEMQLAAPSSDTQLMIDWWLAQKPFGMSVTEYLALPANWVSSASKPMALRAAELYAQLHPEAVSQ